MCVLTFTLFLVFSPWVKVERLRKKRSAAVPWSMGKGEKEAECEKEN